MCVVIGQLLIDVVIHFTSVVRLAALATRGFLWGLEDYFITHETCIMIGQLLIDVAIHFTPPVD